MLQKDTTAEMLKSYDLWLQHQIGHILTDL